MISQLTYALNIILTHTGPNIMAITIFELKTL